MIEFIKSHITAVLCALFALAFAIALPTWAGACFLPAAAGLVLSGYVSVQGKPNWEYLIGTVIGSAWAFIFLVCIWHVAS